jgi:hypothetical protein
MFGVYDARIEDNQIITGFFHLLFMNFKTNDACRGRFSANIFNSPSATNQRNFTHPIEGLK